MTAEVHASLRGSTPSREHVDQLGLLLLVEQRAGAGLGAGMRKLDIAYDETTSSTPLTARSAQAHNETTVHGVRVRGCGTEFGSVH